MSKFRSLEESRIWVSFAGEALNGLVSSTEERDTVDAARQALGYVAAAADLADALLEEYRDRRTAAQSESQQRTGALPRAGDIYNR